MPSPLNIAHRGASGQGLAPENTLAAFRLALGLGADLVELDVHRTKDSHIIVIHDDSLDRTTDRAGKVRDLTFSEIRKADAGKGERVPLFHETLDLMMGRTTILVEIKPEDITADVVQTIKDVGAQNSVVIQSFHPAVVAQAFALAPEMPRGFLIGRGPVLASQASATGASVVVPSYSLLNEETVQAVHAHGMMLWTYTVDEEETMQQMIDLGVDGIITNYPDRLNKITGNRG
jgi:glycerophosphoryl diester phosphodiesterase